jgi:hypothetical protein
VPDIIPPADDYGRLIVIALEVGRARSTLDLFDGGRDCDATIEDLRGSIDRIEAAVRSGWRSS